MSNQSPERGRQSSLPAADVDLLLAHAFGGGVGGDPLRPAGSDARESIAQEEARDLLQREAGAWTQLFLREAEPSAPNAATPADPAPNERLVMQRYRLADEIGRGGVGVVLRGRDVTLQRDVAVKVLRTRRVGSPELVDRFFQEAQIGAQLQHPGIVPVYDVGFLGPGRPFFAMELVHGRTLAALLGERATPAAERSRFLGLFERVCQTVAYAHARGVIHRDLKPGNVMVGAFGQVLVTDWGMAKILRPPPGPQTPADAQPSPDSEQRPAETEPVATARSAAGSTDSTASVSGSVFGTPGFMAPEQARGDVQALDERTDVFALGSILCEILTGQPTFRGSADAALVHARMGDTRDALADLARCEADPELLELTRACIAVDPALRPANAQAVADAVTRHALGVADRARAAALDAARAHAKAAAERRARNVTTALAVVVLVAGAAIATGWWWIARGRVERSERTARAVDAALAEARALLPAKDAAVDADTWRVIDAVTQRATVLAAGADADPATVERARAFAAETAAASEAARARAAQDALQRRVRERLDQIGAMAANREWQRQDRAYGALFAELGLSPDAGEVETAAAALRVHPVGGELVGMLDEWRLTRRNAGADPAACLRLTQVASAADRDPVRVQLRAWIQNPDGVAVARYAAGADVLRMTVETALLLARALIAAGDRRGAIEILSQSHAVHPRHFWLAVVLSQEARAAGRTQEAIRYATAALAVHPDSVFAGTNLSVYLAETGQHRQGVVLLRRLLSIHAEEPSLLHNLGCTLADLRRHEEALPVLERAVALAPDSAGARFGLARAQRAVGRRDAARQSFEEAVRLAKDFSAPLVSLGAMLCDDLKDFAGAREAFTRAIAVDAKNAEAHYDLGIAHEKLGEPVAALAAWRACVEVNPAHAGAWEQIAWCEMRAERFAAAADAARRAVSAVPGHVAGWFLLGNALAELGERHSARAAWREAVGHKPDFAEAWHNLGLDLAEDPATRAEAIAAFRNAVRAQPELVIARCELARALLADGRRDEAAAEAREVLRLDPDHVPAQELLREIGRQ